MSTWLPFLSSIRSSSQIAYKLQIGMLQQYIQVCFNISVGSLNEELDFGLFS